jgi:hypothetical protein
MAWFEHHASEYRGLWVAVQSGELVGAAPSRKGLVEKLGPISNEPDIVISRIP